MIHFYIGTAIAVILGYFLLKYLDGDYTVIDEKITEKGNLKDGERIAGKYYIIKRIYANGKIKIIKKEL